MPANATNAAAAFTPVISVPPPGPPPTRQPCSSQTTICPRPDGASEGRDSVASLITSSIAGPSPCLAGAPEMEDRADRPVGMDSLN